MVKCYCLFFKGRQFFVTLVKYPTKLESTLKKDIICSPSSVSIILRRNGCTWKLWSTFFKGKLLSEKGSIFTCIYLPKCGPLIPENAVPNISRIISIWKVSITEFKAYKESKNAESIYLGSKSLLPCISWGYFQKQNKLQHIKCAWRWL